MKRLLVLLLIIILAAGAASADEPIYAWVICNPKSEVMLRVSPNKHSETAARLTAGDELKLTGTKRGSWWHCYYLCENGEGWIREDHLSFTEPDIWEEGRPYITTVGNLYTRYSVAGKRWNHYKKRGVKVTVYVMADEWSVTSKGYIMTKYLEVDDGA